MMIYANNAAISSRTGAYDIYAQRLSAVARGFAINIIMMNNIHQVDSEKVNFNSSNSERKNDSSFSSEDLWR